MALRRNPAAPARSAPKTYSSRSNVVSTSAPRRLDKEARLQQAAVATREPPRPRCVVAAVGKEIALLEGARHDVDLTVIVPAYNEAETLGDTLRSLQRQTVSPDQILVVDDCSTDATAEVAESLGVALLRPPENTGSKAGAQSFALDRVDTGLVMAVDADTTLAPDAIEKLFAAFADPEVVAACGFVLPRRVRTMWERGRYVEYMLAFSFFKRIQDNYGKQLKRWSHGFVQNVRLHWSSVLQLGYLRSLVAVAFWDALLASFAYLLLVPVLAIVLDPLVLLAYLVDAPVVLVPVLWQAIGRRETGRALASFPSFFVLRVVNALFMLSAVWREFVMRRPLLVYEKGH